VSRHAVAGTLHVPATQLSEQQSVFALHGWWKLRHVEQFTPTKHSAPLQQPFEQDVALHTHLPPTHSWPVPHAAPVPHLHVPPEQLSAFFASHVPHAAPPDPQFVSEGVSHVEPLQQPEVHVAEQPAQTPALHEVPDAHVEHDFPPDPHAPATLPG
jgi:hypothetical protein